MKRIVSLSVFGENPRYLEGARRQFELAKYWYPGWEYRLYIDDASRIDLPGADVIEIKAKTNGMFWRFLPMFEDAIVIVRDADSRITAREAMAVYEWIASGRKFHLMRDHAWHRTSINAGMLGVRGPLSTELAISMMLASIGECQYGKDEDKPHFALSSVNELPYLTPLTGSFLTPRWWLCQCILRNLQ